MVHITDVKKSSANVEEQFGKIEEAIVNSTSAAMAMVSSKTILKKCVDIVYMFNFLKYVIFLISKKII